MTRLIHLTQVDMNGLDAIQQHMVVEMAENINAAVEMGQVKPLQALEVVRRMVFLLEKANEPRKRAS